MEQEMKTKSCILVWEILWTEEPPGLQSMGSQRVKHDWATERRKTKLEWNSILKKNVTEKSAT